MGDHVPGEIDWTTLWRRVATVMAEHYALGRAHLLTEDVLRFATIRALEVAGITPSQMTIEASLPDGARGHLDLQLGRDAAIEFKFPRDPRSDVSSADPMTLGELLADIYRLAALPHQHRMAIWLLADRLTGYLHRAASRYGMAWPSDSSPWLRLDAGLPARLPSTAATCMASSLAAFQEGVAIEAARSEVHAVASGVHLVVLQVTTPGPSAWPPSTPVVPQRLRGTRRADARERGAREEASREIHSAPDRSELEQVAGRKDQHVTSAGQQPVRQPGDPVASPPPARPRAQLTPEQGAGLDALVESAPFPDPETLRRLKALMPLWRRWS